RLIYADFWQRAVPYTMHMLRHGIFPDQLSTTKAARASVFLIFSSLLMFAGALFGKAAWGFAAAAALALCLVGFLNRQFYKFLLQQKGPAFMIRGFAMQSLTYLMSGVGLIVGVYLYFLRSAKLKPATAIHDHSHRSLDATGRLPDANPHILSVTPHQPAKPDP